MEPKIIYQDKDLLVLSKPAGMVVNRSQTTKNKITLEDWLGKERLGKGLDRQGIIHRLDKETSGLLLVAKNQASLQRWQRQFKLRRVKKTYLALVHGQVKPVKGKIEAPISRNPFNRKRFGVFVGGRPSLSRYNKVDQMSTVKGEVLSLLEVKPETGRTHQIRVHLKHIGYPIVADELYAGRKTSRDDRSWCQRMFLHAWRLELIDELNNKRVRFEAPLSPDLKQVLRKLKKLDVKV